MTTIKSVGRLTVDNSVFLLCDVQERFRSVISRMDHVILTAATMTKASSVFGVPTIITEHYPERLGVTVPEVKQHIHPGCKVYSKKLFSMTTPEVWKDLNAMNRKQAVLFGIEAHVCVFQTTLDLIEKGFEVHILVDGISSQRDFDRNTAMKRLERLDNVYFTTVESVLFALMRSADYPRFKEISNLAKDYGTEAKKQTNPLSVL